MCPKCGATIDETTMLFCPVGPLELDLIRQSGYREFPPRLPTQPIFYPVLNEDHAIQIARAWNAKDAAAEFTGYVTRFRVRQDFLRNYEVQTVGSSRHREFWIPAEDLPAFNNAVVGVIEVIHEFRGDGEDGASPHTR